MLEHFISPAEISELFGTGNRTISREPLTLICFGTPQRLHARLPFRWDDDIVQLLGLEISKSKLGQQPR